MSNPLFLRQGKKENLNAAPYIAGALSITTDERALYLDIPHDSNPELVQRIRISDFIIVPKGKYRTDPEFQPYLTNALYYEETTHALYKYDAGEWHHLNEKIEIDESQLDLTDIKTSIAQNASNIADLSSDIADNAAAITSLQTALAEEITRASGAEADLATSIAAETTRAEGAETALGTRIGEMASSVASNKTAIEAEVTRATGVEEGLAKDIQDAKAAVTTLSGSIEAELTELAGQDVALGTALAEVEASLSGEDTKIREEFAAADATLSSTITEAYQAYVLEQLAVADAMKFMGVLHKPEDVPTTNVEKGYTYKIGTEFPYNDVTYRVGDLMIAIEDQEGDVFNPAGWERVSSGFEAKYDPSLHMLTNATTPGLYLKGGVDATRGILNFMGSANAEPTTGGIEVSVARAAESDDGENITLSFGIVWGSF